MIKLNDNQTSAQQIKNRINRYGLSSLTASRKSICLHTKNSDAIFLFYHPERQIEDLLETEDQHAIALLIKQKAEEEIESLKEKVQEEIQNMDQHGVKFSRVLQDLKWEIEQFEEEIVNVNLFIEELDRNTSTQEEEIDLMI